MDVRQYYRKLREIETGISEPFVFVTSFETSDGGKAGILSEVSREQAAKLIVEGRAVLADNAETAAYLENRIAEKKAFERAEMARRLQVTIVQSSDSDDLKASPSATEVRK